MARRTEEEEILFVKNDEGYKVCRTRILFFGIWIENRI